MRSLVTAAALALAALPCARPVVAQSARLATAAQLLNAPGGRGIAELRVGAPVTPRGRSGAFTQVVIEGYLDSTLVGGARDSFAISVRAPSGAMLRAAGAPGAAVLAELRDGMGIARVSVSGRWSRVRRVGWVATSALGAGAVAAVAPSAPGAAAPARGSPARPAVDSAAARARKPALDAEPAGSADPPSDTTLADAGAMLAASRGTALKTSRDGATLATVARGTTMTPLARERGWVRVRVEGWVQETDAVPADTTLRSSLSAADLRADPETNRGRIVRWDVEVLALQSADPLRKDLARDEPYLLARGPGSENAVLYLAVPPSLLSVARALPPLAKITVTARVRVARSEPVGVPVLDVQSITRR